MCEALKRGGIMFLVWPKVFSRLVSRGSSFRMSWSDSAALSLSISIEQGVEILHSETYSRFVIS